MGQGQQDKVTTSLPDAVGTSIGASLAPVDAELARRYPGDPGTRQPVHTVYVPADAFDAGTVRSWGDQALAALDEHAPDAASLARALGISGELAARCTSGCGPSWSASPSRTCGSTSRTATGRTPARRRTSPPRAPHASSTPRTSTAPPPRTWASG